MAFNLIEEQWIPVRAANGRRRLIAPWQVTDTIDGAPVVWPDSPRPDFNGALMQFLIGLLQTSGCATETDEEYLDRLEEPPAPEELHQELAPLSAAFNLDGEYPRFLQDLTMETGHQFPIKGLLIDLTGNGHFIKPKDIDGLCYPCAATALFCLQTNAPEGGAGHLTGMRGGGPLTTLVLPQFESLWETLWLNVVPKQELTKSQEHQFPDGPSDIFPWLAPTREGNAKKGVLTYPEHAHPFQMYWTMPRRIRLDCDELGEGYCGICGGSSERLVKHFSMKTYGVNYEGKWKHPLTPYTRDTKKDTILSRKARSGTISYRNWIGLVLKSTDPDGKEKTQRLPALVVYRFVEDLSKVIGKKKRPVRLWGFGYDMEHMRAKCWYEGQMPIPAVLDDKIANHYAIRTDRMVRAAVKISGNLSSCIKEAWGKASSKTKADTSFVTETYWSRSESVFFSKLTELIDELRTTRPDEAYETLRKWHRYLCELARDVFDEYATKGPIEHENPARIARARNNLNAWNHGPSVREKILGLPKKASDEA